MTLTDPKSDGTTKGDEISLSKLIKQRGIIKGRLTKFGDYLACLQTVKPAIASSAKYKELELKLNKLQSVLSEFDDVQNQIDLLHSDSAEQIKERDDIENQFMACLAVGQDILDNASLPNKSQGAGDDQSSMASCQSNSFNGIKLPSIKLPTFRGDYLQWLEFRDSFESMIHSNGNIPPINKFHYLRSALEGSASTVIKSIEFSANNYKLAWDLLCERYNNSNILINNHLKALFGFDTISKESYKALRFLVDHFSKHLRALETLGQPTDKWDTLIIFIVSGKLDLTTSKKWEEYKCSLKELPTLNEFYSFLRSRADVLETSYSNHSKRSEPEHTSREHYKARLPSNQYKTFAVSMDKKSNNLCELCDQSHRLYDCSKLKEMSVEDRINEISRLKLCKNCFRKNHNSFNCNLRGCCRICKKKHNTLLHKPAVGTEGPLPSSSNSPVALSVVSTSQVLLCTALVDITYNEKTFTARALLDSASQSSFITTNLKRRLGLNGESIKPINICGINNIKSSIEEECLVKINSRVLPFVANVKCFVIPQITSYLPNMPVDITGIQLPVNIRLADPGFYSPAEVDILLGANVYWDIIKPNIMRLGTNKPVLQESQLGWLVAGPVNKVRNTPDQVVCNFTQEIHDSLEKFWSIDELPSKKTYTPEEQICEEQFVDSFTRLPSGRFSVQIPFKEEPEKALGHNFYVAKKCLENLEKKFQRYPNLKQQYRDFLKEYSDLGHLTRIDRPEFGCYLPHHAVVRDKSETTKLRVVFNASCKTSSGKSLNDIQRIGPIVQSDLMSLLLRFRQHKYVLIGDIEKMYRQIEIDPAQRHLQLILWREDADHPVQVLRLNTVTYGTSSAPFLSTRCLLQLALECPDNVISNVIKNDFYVDDLNTGADTVEELQHIAKGVMQVLASACFPLRKIRTNCSELFTDDETSSTSLDISKESSVLGLNYSPVSDTLQFSRDQEPAPVCTKRSVISTTCKIFDPLGLMCPCTIIAKILLQRLWSEKLDWDDPVPKGFAKDWSRLVKDFSHLSEIKVPRRVLWEAPEYIELHCFVDASQQAYAACVYIRSVSSDGTVTVHLLCAKARVAPIKLTTIPRLELCGMLLGARLCNKVCQSLRCDIKNKFIWTDSTVVLAWLKAQSKDLKAFVCNRINEIHELTPNYTFCHVPTDKNPADIASRGIDPVSLRSCSLWWNGPSFLRLNESDWPIQTNRQAQMPLDLPEMKVSKNLDSIQCHVEVTNDKVVQFERYSSFNKLKRVYAYVLRFINNCQAGKTKLTGDLDIAELDGSLILLLRSSQSESFVRDLENMKQGKQVHRRSKLLQLNPFIHSDGTLRVGGRIQNSDFEYDKKHPVILDAKHHLAKLIMRHEHIRLFHAGPQHLLASVREKFWPIGGRNLARSTTRQCMICTRLKGKTLQPIMGNVPAERVASPYYAFDTCGVDMAGPFLIASKKGRGSRTSKCYLCLFVCLASKVVHLEVVSDLSTEAFILALRRFVSRRGRPITIYCDNGSNFKGAHNELGRLIKSSRQTLHKFGNDQEIKFKFSPAYSPHFGGIWEAGVKSAKYHLRRTVGKVSLTFEELETLFTQIEAILNSRPLTPLSSDPTDPCPLTPGHFLIGRPLTSVPSRHVTTKYPNRYERIEQLRRHFWERWQREFIAELQQRTKWQTRQQELKVGDLVILKEEQLPPLQWRFARISRLYPGPDGVSRVADVTTHRGTLRRAINKMCIIPTTDAIEGTNDQHTH